MPSNQKKAATLGMPHGTATGRLRKIILFSLLCKLKENFCFKCHEEIKEVDDLSIEHKEPWEGISADLFWSLDNIAFSHIWCNRPHRTSGNKIQTPEGMAWCSGHQKALPISDFHKCQSREDGLQGDCRQCRAKKDKRVNHAKI